MPNLFSLDGKVVRNVDLPEAFKFPIRNDLIIRFTNAYQSNGRTPYGSYWFAGNRRVGHNMGPNHGISRYPRVAGSSRGVLLSNARGGRSAHHPVTAKNWDMKVNRKERTYAKLSALSSTVSMDLVKKRGHKFTVESLPVILEDRFENIEKTKEATDVLVNVGVFGDIIRSKEGTKIRAGRGKSRGRKYITPKSILFVVRDKSHISKALKNLPGVDIARPEELNAYVLAPGGHPGRLLVITEGALNDVRGWKI
ncbi:MAG: 50S ribosomal protein L4 [Thermoplasmatales archaeon]|jgi:large subunit ribosomal protein L4e|nr:50S ribosomal protein L4 [Candidatus Thermoplasmatota archaeon]MDA8055153.1 50S ribosomal protein L4 [Thermoplasmatales archaeon]